MFYLYIGKNERSAFEPLDSHINFICVQGAHACRLVPLEDAKATRLNLAQESLIFSLERKKKFLYVNDGAE